MMTVNEVSKLTGVSIRALQYYDKIGLLHPAEYTEAGYRLYDDTALERLQQILLFRELEFSLKEIQSILQSPDFDRDRALDQQICLLTLKKEHIENLITFARGLKQVGGMNMDFSAFDTAKMDEYATKAKEKWQHTNAYQEYTQKNKGRSKDAEEALARGVMLIFSDFGKCKDGDPALPEAQALVKRLQAYISENYYQCTPENCKLFVQCMELEVNLPRILIKQVGKELQNLSSVQSLSTANKQDKPYRHSLTSAGAYSLYERKRNEKENLCNSYCSACSRSRHKHLFYYRSLQGVE